MKERSELIECIRSELVGPARPLADPVVVEFTDRDFVDSVPLRRGSLAWRPAPDADLQEMLYFDRESPHRKYGAGILHSVMAPAAIPPPDQAALQAADGIGAEPEDDAGDVTGETVRRNEDDGNELGVSESGISSDTLDDFEVTSQDVRRPSTIGISFCVQLDTNGQIIVELPQKRRFSWQAENAQLFPVNGRYESCTRRWTDENGGVKDSPVWRRVPAVLPDTKVIFDRSEFISGQVIRKNVMMPENSPVALRVDVFPRHLQSKENIWLLTVVLRNISPPGNREHEAILYQTLFEILISGGRFEKYPESRRSFAQLDSEEQSLALLYRESATWGIGHGCAAGWDAEPGQSPATLYADVMPAVQLPSITPEISIQGTKIQLSMRALANLPDDGTGTEWQLLDDLAVEYGNWIQLRREEADKLSPHLAAVAFRHLDACVSCLERIKRGVALLRSDSRALRAFRMANLAMLLQQIAAKQLARRSLYWKATSRTVTPEGEYLSPWSIYENGLEDTERIGSWRAFQIAFLLMSLNGVLNDLSEDREIVDLIWFPTGGGKTEAYLAVMAFYMFHERLMMETDSTGPGRDGTNAIMRYTLRMLTTQQFQRAASLICAMEYMRRNPESHRIGKIHGKRFSLGLWIGGEGSPNSIKEARKELVTFQRGDIGGNPMILTECPWCRAEIGRYGGNRPRGISNNHWNMLRTRGITDTQEGPLLLCPDGDCEFGQENSERWLPVEIIDERIYKYPPSLVIATADKLAMIAYRPAAGALFGRRFVDGEVRYESLPPGLIIQDELHLISGPLGTMYALYESIFEQLCSYDQDGTWIKPKLIASTATIRGAADQVKTLYARSETLLFPSPGLFMGDSFFGTYARDAQGHLRDGRLYLGIHASDYGSVLTTQVRAFSSALFRPFSFDDGRRDPWWTLLAFYNSIRELGGARTLFDSDIRSRLKFMFNREDFAYDNRRNLRIVEELTSRLSQAEIVTMMDRLSSSFVKGGNTIDACLASNIIEVGVDIDRLSLMGVVGQPKTTATYIQVTGRVGRRWSEQPGLILMIYNPSKSRDRSHFEQFHSYHRRLYERVEPTTATPFALSAIQRGLAGALIAWARQHCDAPVNNFSAYKASLEDGYQLICDRGETVQTPEDRKRSLTELKRMLDELVWKWGQNPQAWEEFPPKISGEYLMLWPGQFATTLQKRRGFLVPSSMRQVDPSGELTITQGYIADEGPGASSSNPAINP